MSKVSEFVKLGTYLKNKKTAENLLARKQNLLRQLHGIKIKKKHLKKKIQDIEYRKRKGFSIRTEKLDNHRKEFKQLENDEKRIKQYLATTDMLISKVKARLKYIG